VCYIKDSAFAVQKSNIKVQVKFISNDILIQILTIIITIINNNNFSNKYIINVIPYQEQINTNTDKENINKSIFPIKLIFKISSILLGCKFQPFKSFFMFG